MDSIKKYLAEFVGTFILVVIGCGTAVATGANVVATALAFGISIVALAYSVGRISGGHVNPAVSLGVYLNGGMSLKDFCWYVVAQILGAIAGSAVLGAFFGGYKATGANNVAGIEALGVEHGPALAYGFVIELVLTCIFVLAVLGLTSKKEDSSVAGLGIGAVLTGVHLLAINLTGTSVNPVRSLSAALFALAGGDTESIKEIWIFILAPLAGAALAALLWRYVFHKGGEEAK